MSTAEAGLVEDYDVLRTGVGVVALGRDVLRVSGADALTFLQGQVSQDLAPLEVGASVDALVLSPQGKLDALVRVSRTGEEELVVDVEAGYGDALAARLRRFKLRVKVDIEPVPWRCVAVRGPGAGALEAEVRTRPGVSLTPRYDWNGVSGFDVLGESPTLPDGVRLCSADAWESVRVESGIPVMGAELDERTIAAEADLLDRTVSFTKGCYTGQELVARLDARGNRVARRLRGLVVVGLASGGVGPTPGTSVIPAGSELVVQGKAVGAVTSAAWSPTFHCPVALAYVHRTVEPPGTVELRLGAPGSSEDAGTSVLGVEVRALPLV